MDRKRMEEKMMEEERSRLEFERQERELKEREEHERRMREAESEKARFELEEAEKRRREDELERQRRLDEEADDRARREREERERKRRKTPPKKPAPVEEFKGTNDPLVFNEGDTDLEPFLKPLLSNSGGDVRSLELELLKNAYSSGTLQVVGVKLWNAIHSETWRHREAAAEGFYQFLTSKNGIPDKYIKDRVPLFGACCDVAMVACRDKLLQIYFLGLKLLELSLT